MSLLQRQNLLIEFLKKNNMLRQGTGALRLSMRGSYELEGTLTVHVPWWGPDKV